MLGNRPPAPRPLDAVADRERPALALDRVPRLGGEAGRGDRREVPADRGLLANALLLLGVVLLELLAAGGERAPALVARRALHLLGERHEARLRVAVDGEVHGLVALLVLVVGAREHVLHRDV